MFLASLPGLPVLSSRYRLLRILGTGGMASVYLAELVGHERFSRRCALKLIHPHLLVLQPEFSALFINEARLGGYLSHRNIIQTLDFGCHEGQLFIAMEYVEGPTLSAVLRWCRLERSPMPLELSLELMIELCRGLDYAHSAVDHEGQAIRFIHRDLKPSNILISRHGEVKFADFGVARASCNLDQTLVEGTLKGTAMYMPPEQARGTLELDHRVDLFAIGAVFFEMLTLEALYSTTLPGQALSLAQAGDVAQRLSIIPDSPVRDRLITVLEQALAFCPDDRFQSAGELELALMEIKASLPSRSTLKSWMRGVMVQLNFGTSPSTAGKGWTAPPALPAVVQPTLTEPEAEPTAQRTSPPWIPSAPSLAHAEPTEPELPGMRMLSHPAPSPLDPRDATMPEFPPSADPVADDALAADPVADDALAADPVADDALAADPVADDASVVATTIKNTAPEPAPAVRDLLDATPHTDARDAPALPDEPAPEDVAAGQSTRRRWIVSLALGLVAGLGVLGVVRWYTHSHLETSARPPAPAATPPRQAGHPGVGEGAPMLPPAHALAPEPTPARAPAPPHTPGELPGTAVLSLPQRSSPDSREGSLTRSRPSGATEIASLTVNAVPAARVSLGERVLGETPQENLQVAVGRQTLTVRFPEGSVLTQSLVPEPKSRWTCVALLEGRTIRCEEEE